VMDEDRIEEYVAEFGALLDGMAEEEADMADMIGAVMLALATVAAEREPRAVWH